ncbi:hypothetical protein [Devosia sp.]|uniref:hypothetical protein n=1 Tax=Devosia sp. TaxID=1871048 RepID=UPI002732CCB4|nr:hypothetical protein [Devosia sp.]MDP2779640.1 hypothetical protein [Devosia sp.]
MRLDFDCLEIDADSLRLGPGDRGWDIGWIMGDVIVLGHARIDLIQASAQAGGAMRRVGRLLGDEWAACWLAAALPAS